MINIGDFLNQKIIDAANKLSIENELDNRPYSTAILPQQQVTSDTVLLSNISSNSGPVLPVVKAGQAPVEDSFSKVSTNKVQLMHSWVTATKSNFTTESVMRRLNGMAASGTFSKDEAQIIANSLFTMLFYNRVQRWLDLQTLQFDQLLTNPNGFVTTGDVHNDVYSYTLDGVEEISDTLTNFSANPITNLLNIVELASSQGTYPDTIFLGTNLMNLFLNSTYWKNTNPMPAQFEYVSVNDGATRVAKNARLLYEYPGIKIIGINLAQIMSNQKNMSKS